MVLGLKRKHRIYIKDKIVDSLDLSSLYGYLFMRDADTFAYFLKHNYIDKREVNPMKLYASSTYYQNTEYFRVVYASIFM